jgi:hypothetical protein
MSFFDLDPTATQNAMDQATLNPIKPGDLMAPWYEGSGTGLWNGLKTAYNRYHFANTTDAESAAARKEDISNIIAYKPDPHTVGFAGQLLHGFADTLGTAALNVQDNWLPNLVAAATTDTFAKSQTAVHIAEGMDPATAASVGSTEGVGAGLGLVLPAGMAGNLGVRAASGAGVNFVMGAGQRAIIQNTLEKAGYADMAKQYAPFDGASMATDIAIGALFGGLLGERAHTKGIAKPTDLDTALTMNNAAHVELGTAPGIPADPAARQAHVDAVNAALESLMKGEEVIPHQDVTGAKFVEDPQATAARAETVRVVQEHLGPEWEGLQSQLRERGLPDDTELYRRGTSVGDTVENITQAVKDSFGKDTESLVENGSVKVVEKVSDLPPRADGAEHPADTQAVYDGKTVTIAAENVHPSEVKGLVVHEVGAHMGLEGLLGKALHDQLLGDVAAKVDAGDADFVAAREAVPKDTPSENIGKETLAHLVETRPDLPFVQRILSQIKAAIYRLTGGRFIDLNADDIRTLAISAIRRTSKMQEGASTGNILYARGKPGVESPGSGVGAENLNGFEPDLRVRVPIGNMKLPEKPLVLTGTNKKNAMRQIAGIDEVLAKFPNADKSPLEWSKMMAYAMATNDVPIPPYRFLKDINSDGAFNSLSRLSAGQIADAKHGFENAQAFRDAYTSKQLDVETTGKLFMWSFLSRGVSPYTQEGLFIDGFHGAGDWIKKAADGKFTEADFPAYEAWAKSVAPQGSGQPGSGATHNLNAFGRLFLYKMGQRDENGISLLQQMHNMMEDPTITGQQIRRWFTSNTEGVGIDNKVVSFTLLVAGFKDLMVLDRVQIRQLWDDGRFAGRNLYDGRKVDGKPVAGSMLSEITYGARGLLIYEAIERALQKRLENIYTALGRPEDASVGRYHWETWVADSQQEASHGTLDAILHDAQGNSHKIGEVTAKEGEYGAYAYGAKYGRDASGQPYFLYGVNGGPEYRFSVPAFREFMDAVKSPKNGIVPSKFKVTEAGNAPWYERPEVNKQALDQLARSYAGKPGAPEGAGAVRADGAGQAVSDRAGRGSVPKAGTPEALMADRPDITVPTEGGGEEPAARALTRADAEIASAKQDSQGYDAAVACSLRG